MARKTKPITGPPYLAIVGEIRRRISAGELRAGGRVPSTRQIARDWGVATATATKALTMLRHEGLIRSLPRVGMVVAGAALAGGSSADAAPGLSRERIVEAAIQIADVEGLPALSMRAVAARLDVPTMSLYRHVASKETLVQLMTDAAFAAQELPPDGPAGWRSRLEAAARLQWALCRRHPWLPQVVTLNRPILGPQVIAHAEWVLSAVADLGLDAQTMMNVHVTVYSFVRGIAINLESERQAEADTGITEQQWVDNQASTLAALAASGSYPTFARIVAESYDLALDRLFEFGLQPLLDGLAKVIARARRK